MGINVPGGLGNTPYPPYVNLVPGATTPTVGAAALSGAMLPGGYTGIIFPLNQDSDRHFHLRDGTANISIPLPTVPTLLFGFYQGVRPRAEFDMEMRYLSSGLDLRARTLDTNIMAFGYVPNATGHDNVRLVVRKAPCVEIRSLVLQHGRVLPQADDVALLEWPTAQRPTFRLSLLERGSALSTQAESLLMNAAAKNQLVGQSACWLPPALSPIW